MTEIFINEKQFCAYLKGCTGTNYAFKFLPNSQYPIKVIVTVVGDRVSFVEVE